MPRAVIQRTVTTATAPHDADVLNRILASLDRLDARQARMDARQGRIETALAALLRAKRRRRGACPDAEQLFSAIAAERGASLFGARVLQASTHAELRTLIADADAKTIGAWLRELHARGTVGQYRLARVGRDGYGALWSVRLAV